MRKVHKRASLVNQKAEAPLFVTTFAIKAIITRPDGKVLLISTKDADGKKYWDLPGGRMRKGESVSNAVERKLKEEVLNIPIVPDAKYELFTPQNGLVFLGRKVGPGDILFAGVKIRVDIDFEPELAQHLGYVWVDMGELERLRDGGEVLLQDWIYKLVMAAIKGETVEFGLFAPL